MIKILTEYRLKTEERNLHIFANFQSWLEMTFWQKKLELESITNKSSKALEYCHTYITLIKLKSIQFRPAMNCWMLPQPIPEHLQLKPTSYFHPPQISNLLGQQIPDYLDVFLNKAFFCFNILNLIVFVFIIILKNTKLFANTFHTIYNFLLKKWVP